MRRSSIKLVCTICLYIQLHINLCKQYTIYYRIRDSTVQRHRFRLSIASRMDEGQVPVSRGMRVDYVRRGQGVRICAARSVRTEAGRYRGAAQESVSTRCRLQYGQLDRYLIFIMVLCIVCLFHMGLHLLVSLGGAAALFLGCSFISIAEFGYFLVEWIIGHFVAPNRCFM